MIDKSKLYRCTISPGIAEVFSSVRVIPGFFPVSFDRQQDPETIYAPQISITFMVKDLPSQGSYPAFSFGHMRGEPLGDRLRGEFTLFDSMKARIEISGLRDGPTITANRPYYRFGRLRLGDFCPPGTHLRDVLLVKLIKAGYVPFHGSAFASADNGIVVVGPPRIGKTLILLQAIEQGCQYVGDDLVIADSNGHLYPCPSMSSIAYESGIKRTARRYANFRLWNIRFVEFLSRMVPLAGYLFPPPYLDIRLFTTQLEIAGKTKARHVFILARGDADVRKLSAAEALRMIIIMNRLEFCYHENRLLLAYSMLNPWLDLAELMHAEEKLLENLVGCSTCFLCVAPSPDEYFSLIQQSI